MGVYNILLPPTSFCDIDYNQYIETENICSLDVPLECGLWTKTLSDYRKLIDSVQNVINQYQLNCGEPVVINNDGTSINDGGTNTSVNVGERTSYRTTIRGKDSKYN